MAFPNLPLLFLSIAVKCFIICSVWQIKAPGTICKCLTFPFIYLRSQILLTLYFSSISELLRFPITSPYFRLGEQWQYCCLVCTSQVMGIVSSTSPWAWYFPGCAHHRSIPGIGDGTQVQPERRERLAKKRKCDWATGSILPAPHLWWHICVHTMHSWLTYMWDAGTYFAHPAIYTYAKFIHTLCALSYSHRCRICAHTMHTYLIIHTCTGQIYQGSGFSKYGNSDCCSPLLRFHSRGDAGA